MRIPFKNKLLVLSVLSIIVYVGGCVDTSVQPIPNQVDYRSQIKIVNLVQGSNAATLTLNGTSLGSVNFGDETPATLTFLDIPAGNKVLDVNYGAGSTAELKFTANTDYKFRVFLIGTPANSDFVKVLERYIWQTKDSQNGTALFPADTGQVAFFNGSPNTVLNKATINDTLDVTLSLATGSIKNYIKLKAGTYSFKVSYNDSLQTVFDYNVGSKSRYTVVVYDTLGSIKNKVLVDD